jgi:uncharacterized protein YbaR (Trm112 family)
MVDFVLGVVVLWLLYMLHRYYQIKTRIPDPPIPMRDTGNGVMQPVCPECQVTLVTLTRETGAAAESVTVWILALLGLGLLLVAPIFGILTLILAAIVGMNKKTRQSVLSCPVCGKDFKTLN